MKANEPEQTKKTGAAAEQEPTATKTAKAAKAEEAAKASEASAAEASEESAVLSASTHEADRVVRHAVYAAMGLGIVPIPLFNFAAVTAGNLIMARKLAGLYGVEFKEGVAKKIIASVVSSGAGTLASPLVESLVSGIPLVGLPLTIGTKPALNGMTTYALGRMFITHFESDGTFVGANIDAMKKSFKNAYANSREWLGNTIKGRAEKTA